MEGSGQETYLARLKTISFSRRTLLRTAATLTAGAAAASLLGGCDTGAGQRDAVTLAQSGGASLTDSLDPGISFLITTTTGHLFDNLIGATDDFQQRPGLAESWRVVDEKTWEFKLRPNVKFHDGEPVKASDVKFTVERIQHPDYKSSGKANVANVQEVQVVDQQTVRMITKIPYAALPSRLVSVLIVPEHYMNRVGVEEASEKPIGSGPYKFVEWRKGDRVIVERNDTWWGVRPS